NNVVTELLRIPSSHRDILSSRADSLEVRCHLNLHHAQTFHGELGNPAGSDTDDASPPVLVTGISNATAIATGSLHTCVVLATGHVSCWGANESGELGSTTNAANPFGDNPTPTEVAGITNATGLAGGEGHTCALLTTGHIDCWGYNGLGELGNPTGVGTASFTTVPSEVT